MLDSHEGVTIAGPPDHSARPTAGWHRYATLLLPCAVMAALGFWGLGRHDAMGNDEVATRWVSSLSLHDMVHVLRGVDAVHGLYYLIIHFWRVFGDTPTAIRVPSVLAMIAAVGVIGVIAIRLSGSSLVGMLAGLLAALTPSTTFYAQTARSYALVYLVVALTTLLLIRALETESAGQSALVVARRWVTYGLLIVLAGYLNELSMLMLGAHLVTIGLSRPGRRATLHWLAASVLAVLAILPLVRISQRESSVLGYLKRPDLHDLRALFHSYFATVTVIGIAIAVFAVIGLFPNRKSSTDTAAIGRPSLASVAAPLAIVPPGVLLLYSEIFRPLYANRYVLFGEIGVALLGAAGLERIAVALANGVAGRGVRLRQGWSAASTALTALAACVCVFAFQITAQERQHRPMSREFNFGDPAAIVGAGARPGDGVLFFNSFYRKMRLGYPQDFENTDDFAMRIPPARAGNFRGADKPLAAIRPLMLARSRIWVVGNAPVDTKALGPSYQGQAQVLRRQFVLVSGHHFGRIHVTLWRRA